MLAGRLKMGDSSNADARLRGDTEAASRLPRAAKCSLILPEIAKPFGRKFAISNRMLDVLVAEIVLQRPSIHTLIGQLEPS
jgi:hypothetical protein